MRSKTTTHGVRFILASGLSLAALLTSAAHAGPSSGLGSGPGPGSGPGNGPNFSPPAPATNKDGTPAAPDKEPRPNEQRIDLRPKWEPGQVIRYVMKQESQSAFAGLVMPGAGPSSGPGSGPGKQAPADKVKNIQEIGFSLRVKSVDKATGVAVVDMVYDRVKITLTGMGIDVNFDSSKPATNPGKKPAATQPSSPGIPGLPNMPALEPEKLLESHMQGLVGQTMTLTIDRSGKITSVSGGEKLDPTGMLSALGGQGSTPAGPQSGGGLFGPISTSGGNDGTARIGESWTNIDKLSVGALGDMDMRTTHRLRSASRGLAELTFEGRVDGSASSGKPATAQLDAASNRGTYTWDYDKGQLVKMRLEQRVNQAMPQSGTPTGNPQAESATVMTVERVR